MPETEPARPSRRALFALTAGAAAVTALPAIASAASGEPDPVIALADRTIELHRAYQAAVAAFRPYDEAMLEWHKANPPPPRPQPITVDHDKDARTITLRGWLTGDEFKTAVLVPEKRAQRNYRRRERAAARRVVGYTEAKAAHLRAGDLFLDAVNALALAHPRTMAGLAAKARAARLLQCHDALAQKLMFDIGIVAGELTAEQVDRDAGREDQS